jgi:hypothetical protein
MGCEAKSFTAKDAKENKIEPTIPEDSKVQEQKPVVWHSTLCALCG